MILYECTGFIVQTYRNKNARIRAVSTGMYKRIALACLLAAVSTTIAAEPWDTTRTYGAVRDIDFETTEGTDTSVDTSPDGRWLAFDLLGDIYRVAAGGGDAELLTRGGGQSARVAMPDSRLGSIASS